MSTSEPIVVNVNEDLSSEPFLEPKKPKKPFKVHYYKDQKTLQLSFAFKKEKGAEDGLFSQLNYLSFYQGCLTEFLGTYLLVLFVIGFGLNMSPADSTQGITGALGSGFLVATIVWFFPTCHINPAVSAAFLLAGEANTIKVLFYVPAQLLGSTAAVGTLHNLIIDPVVSPNGTVVLPQIGLTLLNPKLGILQGVVLEAVITFVLLLTIFACIDKHRSDLSGSYPLTIGFSVTIGCLFGGQFTGGSMNPARSFGPAFMADNFGNHFVVYWLGPISGAVLAPLVYKALTFKTSTRVN